MAKAVARELLAASAPNATIRFGVRVGVLTSERDGDWAGADSLLAPTAGAGLPLGVCGHEQAASPSCDAGVR
jgi:hypothetical protein